MKGVKQPFGYTIVELMIVLAVSGAMFAIAANFIGGKQERTSFQQGSNELVSRVQGAIEEVTDGQFTDIRMSCDTGTGVLNISASADPNHGQGQNPNCVFLGKLFHFTEDGDTTKYEMFSLAGTSIDPLSGKPVDLAGSKLIAVDTNVPTSLGKVTTVNLTRQYTTPQRLDIVDMKITPVSGVATNQYYSFGFTQGLGTATKDLAGNKTGTYQSGTQTVGIIYAPIVKNKTQLEAVGKISAADVQYAKAVCVAVYDGTRGALINIGDANDNGSKLSVSIQQLGVTGSPVCP